MTVQFRKVIVTLLVLSKLQVAAAAGDLSFNSACEKTEDIEIVGVGDFLLHGTLQSQAVKHADRFRSLWLPVIPLFQQADLAYANLEGPVAPQIDAEGRTVVTEVGHIFDDLVYTSYPKFNYHPFLVDDMKASGIDIVSTANNHSLDRRSIGADLTIQHLRRSEMAFTGTRTAAETQNKDFLWHTVTETKGRRVAWIACTYSTNGIKDKLNQVLMCYQQTETLLSQIKSLSDDPSIDAVIVTPHWGEEYVLLHNEKQTILARQMIEVGATAVIGTHPHVVQPWEKYTTKQGREGFIVYSTGNFVSGMAQVERVTAMMLKLTLTGEPNAKLKIRGVGYVPLIMKRRKLYQVQPVFDVSLAPVESQAIWKNAYGEKLRIKSEQDNSFERLCTQ